ncbi:MAG: regulatory protein RecX [Tissierellia bacterium]|nr:regulatory protein RecX [Bacillota bacterium]NLL22932.1 regulatory protein RecX [Tissierellia bacterium]
MDHHHAFDSWFGRSFYRVSILMKLERVVKEKQKVTVTVEGEEYALHPFVWAQFAVFEGEEIDIEKLVSLSDREYALQAALGYATKYQRTRFQVSQYLERKDLPVTEELLDQLEEWGVIDDFSFALNYAQSLRGKNGPYYIRAKLAEKGISQEIIHRLDLDENPDVMEEILRKKYGNWEDISVKECMKRQKFLVGRGFSFESSRKTVEKMKKASK